MTNPQFKLMVDGLEVEYEILPPETDKQTYELQKSINRIDNQLESIWQEIEKSNISIDGLTNHADRLDYTIAVASGIITGMIDAFWVGEFSLDRANEWGKEKVNNFVIAVSKHDGYTGDNLPGAIQHLEETYKIAADKATNEFGGGNQHHLRDFSHHPTPVGLFFSMLTQFTGNVYGTDTSGSFQVVSVDNSTLIGKNLPEKITFGLINWFFHMVSDMAGSSSSARKKSAGTSLPGPLVSFLKEISALPIFRKMNEDDKKEFSVWISKLFNGTLLGKRDEKGKLIEAVKFDLRTEIGVAHEIGRQTVPVIVNECVVRGFYFLRRLFTELKEKNVTSIDDLKNINWRSTLPFKNRTIVRMLTVSTGTFAATDIFDAIVHGLITFLSNSSSDKETATAEAVSEGALRINFIGIGRLTIAVGSEIKQLGQRSKRRNERIEIYNQQIQLLNAKVFYEQAGMWISAENTRESIEELFEVAENSIRSAIESVSEIHERLERIDGYIENAEENNPGLSQELLDILTWG